MEWTLLAGMACGPGLSGEPLVEVEGPLRVVQGAEIEVPVTARGTGWRRVEAQGLPPGVVSAPLHLDRDAPVSATMGLTASVGADAGGPWPITFVLEDGADHGGETTEDLYVAGPRGSWDRSFGERGVIYNGVDDGWSTFDVSSLVLTDSGGAYFGVSSLTGSGWIGRALPHGGPDPSFGDGDGILPLEEGHQLVGMTVGDDQTLYVTSELRAGELRGVLRAYVGGGELRADFGDGGTVALPAGAAYEHLAWSGHTLLVADGWTVVAVDTADGTTTTWDPVEHFDLLRTDDDGRVLVVAADADGGLRRYLPDGTPDATFGENGRVSLPTVGVDVADLVALARGAGVVVGREIGVGGFVTRFDDGSLGETQTFGDSAVLARRGGDVAWVVGLTNGPSRYQLASYGAAGLEGDVIDLEHDTFSGVVDMRVEEAAGRMWFLPSPFGGAFLLRMWL